MQIIFAARRRLQMIGPLSEEMIGLFYSEEIHALSSGGSKGGARGARPLSGAQYNRLIIGCPPPPGVGAPLQILARPLIRMSLLH